MTLVWDDMTLVWDDMTLVWDDMTLVWDDMTSGNITFGRLNQSSTNWLVFEW